MIVTGDYIFSDNLLYGVQPGVFSISGTVEVTPAAEVKEFVVWDDLDIRAVPSEDNLSFTVVLGNTYSLGQSTHTVSSGKWYWEVSLLHEAGSPSYYYIGAGQYPVSGWPGIGTTSWGYDPISGNKRYNNISQSYGSSAAYDGAVIGIALDLDNGKIFFSADGVWIASGDPVAGDNPAFTGVSGDICPAVYIREPNGVRGHFLPESMAHEIPEGYLPLDTYWFVGSEGINTPGPFRIFTAHVNGEIFVEGSYQPKIIEVRGVTDANFSAEGNYSLPSVFRIQGTGLPDSTFKLPFRIVDGLSWNQQDRLNNRKDNHPIGPWHYASGIPNDAAGEMALWVTKNRVFLAGDGTTVSTAEIDSDGVVGTWTSLPPLPEPRTYAQALVTYRRVYLIGGYKGGSESYYTSDALTASIEPDGTLGEWEIVEDILDGGEFGTGHRDLFGLFCVGNLVYLLGGRLDGAYETYTCRRALIDGEGRIGTFYSDQILPSAYGRERAAVIKTKRYVYLIGGKAYSYGNLKTVVRRGYNETGFNELYWTEMPDANIPRTADVRGFATEHRAWLIGGNSSEPNSNLEVYTAEIVDGVLGEFELCDSLLVSPTRGANAFATSSRLYVGNNYAEFYGGRNDYLDFNIQGDFPDRVAEGNYAEPVGQITAFGYHEEYTFDGDMVEPLPSLAGTAEWGHVATGSVTHTREVIAGTYTLESYQATGSVSAVLDRYAGVGWSMLSVGRIEPRHDTFSLSFTTPYVAFGNTRQRPDRLAGAGPVGGWFTERPHQIQGAGVAGVVAVGSYRDARAQVMGEAFYVFHYPASGSFSEPVPVLGGSAYTTVVAGGMISAAVDRVSGIGWIVPQAVGAIHEPLPDIRGSFGGEIDRDELAFARCPVVAPEDPDAPEYDTLGFGRCEVVQPVYDPPEIEPISFSRPSCQGE